MYFQYLSHHLRSGIFSGWFVSGPGSFMEHLVATVGVGPSDAVDLGSAMDVEEVSNWKASTKYQPHSK